MTEEKARKIVRRFGAPEMLDRLSPDEFQWAMSVGYLQGLADKEKEYEPVVNALEGLVQWFEALGKKQHRLLVEGQTFGSASKNWEEATKLDAPLDFGPAIAALSALKRRKGL